MEWKLVPVISVLFLSLLLTRVSCQNDREPEGDECNQEGIFCMGVNQQQVAHFGSKGGDFIDPHSCYISNAYDDRCFLRIHARRLNNASIFWFFRFKPRTSPSRTRERDYAYFYATNSPFRDSKRDLKGVTRMVVARKWDLSQRKWLVHLYSDFDGDSGKRPKDQFTFVKMINKNCLQPQFCFLAESKYVVGYKEKIDFNKTNVWVHIEQKEDAGFVKSIHPPAPFNIFKEKTGGNDPNRPDEESTIPTSTTTTTTTRATTTTTARTTNPLDPPVPDPTTNAPTTRETVASPETQETSDEPATEDTFDETTQVEPGKKDKKSFLWWFISLIVVILLLILFIYLMVYLMGRKKKRRRSAGQGSSQLRSGFSDTSFRFVSSTDDKRSRIDTSKDRVSTVGISSF